MRIILNPSTQLLGFEVKETNHMIKTSKKRGIGNTNQSLSTSKPLESYSPRRTEKGVIFSLNHVLFEIGYQLLKSFFGEIFGVLLYSMVGKKGVERQCHL